MERIRARQEQKTAAEHAHSFLLLIEQLPRATQNKLKIITHHVVGVVVKLAKLALEGFYYESFTNLKND
jgi:hypothetical protein